jgi:putative endonuclease
MYYVYILQSTKDKQLYTGCTNDLKKRLVLHNAGKVPSTVSRRPLQIIFYEAFISKEDAFAREHWLKTGWGRNHVKKLLERYLKSCGG